MKYYSIGEFSRLIDKTIQTLRNWDNNGKLKNRIIYLKVVLDIIHKSNLIIF